jgi:hypothetical protein
MTVTTVVNLTAHRVAVFDGDAVIAAWDPSGVVARLTELSSASRPIMTNHGEVPVTTVTYADRVTGLPLASPGTAYIVSRVLAAAWPREDLYFPADEVRDETGQIVGCRTLGRFSGPDDA